MYTQPTVDKHGRPPYGNLWGGLRLMTSLPHRTTATATAYCASDACETEDRWLMTGTDSVSGCRGGS